MELFVILLFACVALYIAYLVATMSWSGSVPLPPPPAGVPALGTRAEPTLESIAHECRRALAGIPASVIEYADRDGLQAGIDGLLARTGPLRAQLTRLDAMLAQSESEDQLRRQAEELQSRLDGSTDPLTRESLLQQSGYLAERLRIAEGTGRAHARFRAQVDLARQALLTTRDKLNQLSLPVGPLSPVDIGDLRQSLREITHAIESKDEAIEEVLSMSLPTRSG